MSAADEYQLAHDVPSAVRMRLTAVRDGTATAHDHHQLGVLLSELAESAYRIGAPGWRKQARVLLEYAFEQFRLAHQEGSGVDWTLALACDHALALMRFSRLEARAIGGAVHMTNANKELGRVVMVLEGEDTTDARAHQLAIAYGFLSRLNWGHALGFKAKPFPDEAQGYGDIAATRFTYEGALDSNRAFRSHLLATALAYDAMGNRKMRQQCAAQARRLAIAAGDARHARRARIIWWFGNRGERWMRNKRDRKAITAVCMALASE